MHISKQKKMQTTKLYELKKVQTNLPKIKISQPEDAQKFIRQFYGDDMGIYESFFILLLNRANTTIGYAKISQGGIVGTIVDTKIICKYAIDSLASGVVLAHNHPSGNLTPSSEDIKVTQRIKSALELIETQVIDHIILTEDGFFSMADKGYF